MNRSEKEELIEQILASSNRRAEHQCAVAEAKGARYDDSHGADEIGLYCIFHLSTLVDSARVLAMLTSGLLPETTATNCHYKQPLLMTSASYLVLALSWARDLHGIRAV